MTGIYMYLHFAITAILPADNNNNNNTKFV